MSFIKCEDLKRNQRHHVHNVQKGLKTNGLLEENENITGVFEEFSFVDTMDELNLIVKSAVQDDLQVVKMCSLEMYDVIKAFEARDSVNAINEQEARVDTKYKSVEKKVKPVALPLPTDCREKMEQASLQPSLRDREKVGHRFTRDSLKELKIGCGEFLTQPEQRCFEEMLSKHGKAFEFEPHEIDCVDPSVVAPMVIFTIPHIPWNLRPIPVPEDLLPKLIELLNEKIRMGILEPSCAPYSNMWFTVPKKNGTLRFI
ncbi:hypothetical protein L7F22_025264 [Adiantum nelumboides]|nr:hypothetical protein [Adiantum nelumboides]